MDLLSAPLNAPLVVARVIDQDPEFLRFVEQQHLMPGQAVVVEQRDGAADAVRLNVGGLIVTIGARAASKVLARPV